MKHRPFTWSREENRRAFLQGWNLFTIDDGGQRLQKVDDPPAWPDWAEGMSKEPIFESDNDAVAYVRRLARVGDTLAKKAIEIHDFYEAQR